MLPVLAVSCTSGAPRARRVAPPPRRPHAVAVGLTDCAWSYFGDPRALVHGQIVLTGCVSAGGGPILARADRGTGAGPAPELFARLEAGDHNNPSLVFWRRRL